MEPMAISNVTIEQLYDAYHQPMLRYLQRLVRHRETAEDLCQEAFIKVLRNWEQREGAESVRGWLYRIATNTAYDYLRQQRRAAATLVGQDPAELAADSILDTRWDEVEAIRAALPQIPAHYRVPLLLHACAGYDLKAIAAALGCNINTIKTRVCRGRARFRQAYVA